MNSINLITQAQETAIVEIPAKGDYLGRINII